MLDAERPRQIRDVDEFNRRKHGGSGVVVIYDPVRPEAIARQPGCHTVTVERFTLKMIEMGGKNGRYWWFARFADAERTLGAPPLWTFRLSRRTNRSQRPLFTSIRGHSGKTGVRHSHAGARVAHLNLPTVVDHHLRTVADSSARHANSVSTPANGSSAAVGPANSARRLARN